jgi:hypothetical protein
MAAFCDCGVPNYGLIPGFVLHHAILDDLLRIRIWTSHRHSVPGQSPSLSVSCGCGADRTQVYMFFLTWRFSKRIEHYADMKGPFAGGESEIRRFLFGG